MLAAPIVLSSPLQGVVLAVSLLVGVLASLLLALLFAMPRRIRHRVALYRATFDATVDGILVLDRDNRIVRFNNRCAELLDLSPALLRRAEVGPVLLGLLRRITDPVALLAQLRKLDSDPGATGSAIVEFQDGRAVEYHARPQYLDGEVIGKVWCFHDQTDRWHAEGELEVQRAYFAELFESAPEAIVILGEDGRILRANQEFTRTFGYTLDEVVGRPTEDFIVPPELASESLAMTARVKAGERVSLETVRQRKDGTRVPVSILGTAIRAPGKQIEVYGIYRDITERKQLEEQLLQSQKIEAVGRLAGGVAHDFNNLLTAIRGHTALVMEETPADAPWRAELEEVDRAAGRAANLTRQLLAFSRKQVLNPRVVDLNALVRGVEKLLRRLIGEDVELVTRLAPGECRIKADPGQFEQVLLNLVVNARDAMPGGGRIVVETHFVSADQATPPVGGVVPAAGYVRLAVHDTGHGMDEPTRNRIFEPFFTTKGPAEGTGLGLSTVYGIVEQSCGWLRVESEVGRGTTIAVFLPRVQEPLEAPPPPVHRGTAAGRGETVLLVEDDSAVRALARRVLERQGYHLLAAGTGEEAIHLAGAHEGALDLLLTDVVMPGMSGRELAERLTVARPGIGVLFMSGYTEDDVIRRGVYETGTSFLGKPFTPDALARRVREVIDQRND